MRVHTCGELAEHGRPAAVLVNDTIMLRSTPAVSGHAWRAAPGQGCTYWFVQCTTGPSVARLFAWLSFWPGLAGPGVAFWLCLLQSFCREKILAISTFPVDLAKIFSWHFPALRGPVLWLSRPPWLLLSRPRWWLAGPFGGLLAFPGVFFCPYSRLSGQPEALLRILYPI